MHTFIIGINDAGQRVDKFLLKACPKLPKSLLYKTFRKKDIKRNGKHIPAETFLEVGDSLQVYLPEEFFVSAKPFAAPINLPRPEIIYEDEQLAIMRKPFNLPVHADDKGSSDTMLHRFLNYLMQTGKYDSALEQSFVPALCNRLDRNTEGFVIGAKTAAALRTVNELIRENHVIKQYICVTVGSPPKSKDIVTAYHRRREGHSAEILDSPQAGFRQIITEYQVLQKQEHLALLLVTLHTGRTHQIRAQMAALGAPILGDQRYGSYTANQSYGEQHQLLAACRLRFDISPEGHLLSYLSGRTFSYTPQFCSKYGFSV